MTWPTIRSKDDTHQQDPVRSSTSATTTQSRETAEGRRIQNAKEVKPTDQSSDLEQRSEPEAREATTRQYTKVGEKQDVASQHQICQQELSNKQQELSSKQQKLSGKQQEQSLKESMGNRLRPSAPEWASWQEPTTKIQRWWRTVKRHQNERCQRPTKRQHPQLGYYIVDTAMRWSDQRNLCRHKRHMQFATKRIRFYRM